MYQKFYLLAFFIFILSGCAGDSSTETGTAETAKEEAPIPRYQIDTEAVTVKWTAFKFTERAGVGGTVEGVSVSFGEPSKNPAEVLGGIKVFIPAKGVNSQNPDRDEKIKSKVFGTLNSDGINAKVLSVSGNDREGTIDVAVKFNGIEKIKTFNYKVEGAEITATANFDFSEWNALAGLEALNKVCYDLHKGLDGVSKLWPDVDIEIKAVLKTVQ
jgi:hypothetical protein